MQLNPGTDAARPADAYAPRPTRGPAPPTAAGTAEMRRFRVGWAATPNDVLLAQRLRHRIFVGEMGARLSPPADTPEGLDVDDLDAHCDHLLVRAGDGSGAVVATCRVLSADSARGAGGWYTQREFDLGPVADLLGSAIEMGRVCIDPGWRNGLLVLAIWREIGERMSQRRLDTMIGCCSVGVADGGRLASQLWHDLQPRFSAAAARRVRPWQALELLPPDAAAIAPVPALLKGYLRCGGRLLGPPALDADFNTADFPMLVHLSDLPPRYGQRIFGDPARRPC